MPDKNIISMMRPLDAWMGKARNCMQEGDFLSASRYYRKALDMQYHPVILLELAYAYFSLHSHESCQHLIWEALRRYPLDGEWCFLTAINALNMGDHALGKAALTAYMVLDPQGDHAASVSEMLTSYPFRNLKAVKRGKRAFVRGKYAGNDVDKWIRADACDPTGRSAVMCAELLADQDPEWALRYVQIAFKKGVPRDLRTKLHLTESVCYRLMGHLPESRVAWEKAGMCAAEMSEVESMVRTAIKMDEAALAEELLEGWEEHIPFSAQLLRLQALAAAALGKDEAPYISRLHHVDPFHPRITQSDEEMQQTLMQKRSMIWERISPLAVIPSEGEETDEVY